MVELELNKWLKADDFAGLSELAVVFLDEGSYGEFTDKKDGSKKPTFEIGVSFRNGETRLWTMNMTSQRSVAEHLVAVDTKDWVGKGVTLHLVNQMVGSSMKKVIYACELPVDK